MDDRLNAMHTAGRASWPTLELPLETFVSWLEPRIGTDDPEKLVAADLYLVAACLLGVPGAARVFIEGPLAATERHLLRVAPSAAVAAELLQEMSVDLLTPGVDGGEPKLAQYTGRGALAVWLRMTAARRALNASRGPASRTVVHDEQSDVRVAPQDPELSVLRRRHQEEIAAIFREVTDDIPAEDRALLRMHYVQGSTLGELAVVFRTSKSALHRRVEAVRGTLHTRINELVRGRLKLSASEHGSMMRIFQSDLRDAMAQFLRVERKE